MEDKTVKAASYVLVGLEVVRSKWQRHRCVGLEPYTRTDGEEIFLAIWESECRVCDVPFRCTTSARVIDRLTRTCPDHHGMRRRIR